MITNTRLLFEFPEETLGIPECSSLTHESYDERGDRYSPSMVPGYKGEVSSDLLPQLSYIYNVFFEGKEKVNLQLMSCHV